MCQPRNKKILRIGVSSAEKKKLSLARMTCLADKTNHPVERLSLNRSQCGDGGEGGRVVMEVRVVEW